ncbi:ATP-dependent DNA helicase [Trichonephila clavipes]|nr:ATP-dependent DNA helicase [Trichonephila clavipes]
MYGFPMFSQRESLLKRHENDPFLKRIITGDEKWVVYNVKRKRSWSKKDKPAQTISKADIHQKKVMLSIWWDFKGIVFEVYLWHGREKFPLPVTVSDEFLSETWLGNESDISIPNFNCIVKNKRPNTRAGGVAIYQNSSDAVNIITPSMECSVSQSDIYGTIQSSVGGLCLAECVIDNGQKIIIVAVYITPNKKLDDIIEFLHRSSLPYTSRGSTLLNKSYDKIPMILSGDFNILPDNTTINSEVYCHQLDKLNDAFQQKRSELINRKGVVFH